MKVGTRERRRDVSLCCMLTSTLLPSVCLIRTGARPPCLETGLIGAPISKPLSAVVSPSSSTLRAPLISLSSNYGMILSFPTEFVEPGSDIYYYSDIFPFNTAIDAIPLPKGVFSVVVRDVYQMGEVGNAHSLPYNMCNDDVKPEHKGPVFIAIAEKYGEGIMSFRDFVAAIERDSACQPNVNERTYKIMLGNFVKIFKCLIDLTQTKKRKREEAGSGLVL